MSLVTVNVLAAVDELIVPCDAGIYSVAGLAKLQGTVADVRAYLGNRRLRIAGSGHTTDTALPRPTLDAPAVPR